MKAYEVNFDGLVGPTHNYGGLSFGNIASQSNTSEASNPQEAALQGLRKMKALHDRGFTQGVLPPHERPSIETLRAIGFAGSDENVLQQAATHNRLFLSLASSASSMWTANAATVSPSADTQDGRVHFTAANLNDKFHRSIEHTTTSRILASIFRAERHFAHHKALPPVSQFGDEGAANHTRLCHQYGEPGVELFVFGRSEFSANKTRPRKYPARQTLEASEAVVRLHGLEDDNVVYAQQNPAVIDAGVFHNDVIAVGNGNVLFYHEQAFLDTGRVLTEINTKLKHCELIPLEVKNADVSVEQAVKSYLFNSQLLSRPDGKMLLVVPQECHEVAAVSSYLQQLQSGDNPIAEVVAFDLKQSMKNGGGPACLRLRVVLTEAELQAVRPGVIMTDNVYNTLVSWVKTHYRDRMTLEDIKDPSLLQESRGALDELTKILGLGSIYPFQRESAFDYEL